MYWIEPVRSAAWAIALFCMSASACAQGVALWVVRDGMAIHATDVDQKAQKALKLAVSCTVGMSGGALSSGLWQSAKTSESYLQVEFLQPREAELAASDGQGRRQRRIQAILLPLPTRQLPEHVLVISDNSILVLTKYNPAAMRDIILEGDLGLSTKAPYEQLASKWLR